MNPDISVVITTFTEGPYLDSLLGDISAQVLYDLSVEIILLEAGDYSEDRAKVYLGGLCDCLTYIHAPGMLRTRALNKIFELAKGKIIVRLDARSHVDNYYLRNIWNLSSSKESENVGGVMKPIGLTQDQQLIADIMMHPVAFGGGKSREIGYSGYVDSVYLGAFNVAKCKRIISEWFDDSHPHISEDSDLNFRIRMAGGKVYLDSSIVVEHYPRENLSRFFRLCFNYGIGRGVFLLKNRKASAYRQLIPPIALLVTLAVACLSFLYHEFFYIFLFLTSTYVALVGYVAFSFKKNLHLTCKAFLGLIGCHLFWTFGLITSPKIFYQRAPD